jgi:hypothetical protein
VNWKLASEVDLMVFVPPPSQPRWGSTAPTVDRVRPPEFVVGSGVGGDVAVVFLVGESGQCV